MLFLTLTLENFGLYHGRHSLNLQPETAPEGQRPIILIGGLNGGGKTTLMDAIRLALYGSRAQIERRKKSQPYAEFLSHCINRQADQANTASVELSFQQVLRLSNIDRLAEIRVQRRWSHSQKETLQVYLDGWPDDSLTQTQPLSRRKTAAGHCLPLGTLQRQRSPTPNRHRHTAQPPRFQPPPKPDPALFPHR